MVAYLMFAAALVCFGLGIVTRRDPRSGRRALVWTFCGQSLLLLTLATQWKALRAERGVDAAANLLVVAGLTFVVFAADPRGRQLEGRFGMTKLFGGTRARLALRSRYEQQIREAAGQEERNRLARDLHDSVKQQIFAIQAQAAAARERFTSDPEGARTSLEYVRQSASEAMREMDAMVDQLRAAPLENNTLVAAIRRQCEALGFRTGAKVEFTLGDLPPSEALVPGAHEVLYRIAQESMSNIAKHARASNVTVRLERNAESLMLVVQDDGSGFDTNQPDRGMGRASMRTRAEEVGGTLEVQSALGAGATVTAAVPLIRASSRMAESMLIVCALSALAALISGRAVHLYIPALWAVRMAVLHYRERIGA